MCHVAERLLRRTKTWGVGDSTRQNADHRCYGQVRDIEDDDSGKHPEADMDGSHKVELHTSFLKS